MLLISCWFLFKHILIFLLLTIPIRTYVHVYVYTKWVYGEKKRMNVFRPMNDRVSAPIHSCEEQILNIILYMIFIFFFTKTTCRL